MAEDGINEKVYKKNHIVFGYSFPHSCTGDQFLFL